MKKTIGQRLKEIRVEKKLNARQLMELSGVSDVEIHNIENGKTKNPQPITIKKLSDSLGVSFEELYDGTK